MSKAVTLRDSAQLSLAQRSEQMQTLSSALAQIEQSAAMLRDQIERSAGDLVPLAEGMTTLHGQLSETVPKIEKIMSQSAADKETMKKHISNLQGWVGALKGDRRKDHQAAAGLQAQLRRLILITAAMLCASCLLTLVLVLALFKAL